MEIADPVAPKRFAWIYPAILLLSGIFFFIPFLGKVHLFDWDEINFAESAREMIVTRNYHLVQINFQPFAEKPPLFFWLQASSMKLFGVNEFAARFPNALFGIITLLTFYFIGKKHRSARFGFLWALCYLGTFLPHVYFKSAIIDPVFNYFIFMGIYLMFMDVAGHRWKHPLLYPTLAGLSIGLGTLTKGPVALLVFGLCFLVFFIFTRFRHFPSWKKVAGFTVAFILVCLLWFGPEIMQNGLWFLKEFIEVQAELFLTPVASHGEPFYYHFVVVFVGCFPISVIALPVIAGKFAVHTSKLRLLMKIIFWAVIILFSLSTTKIVHYSSLTYIPLAFLATVHLEYLLQTKKKMNTVLLIVLGIMGLVFSFLLTALPYVGNHPQLLIPYLEDPFAAASLQVNVQWNGFEPLIGICYFFAVLIAIYFFSKMKNWTAMLVLFFSTACCLFIYLVTVVPKIEQFSQGPAIRFYESQQGKDVYIWPVGFRSYAHYFYAKKPVEPVYGEDDLPFLLTGDITRPAWFVVKITNKNFETKCDNCHLQYQEGGFKFYKREPIKK